MSPVISNPCSILDPVHIRGDLCMSRVACLRIAAFLGLALPLAAFQPADSSILAKLGHSQHGESFDTGPREKPWPIAGHRRGAFSDHHEESRSAALVRPGQRAAAFLLGLRGRARLSLVPEAGARERHGVLGAGACRHLRGSGGPARAADLIREAVKRKEPGQSARTPLHRGAGGGPAARSPARRETPIAAIAVKAARSWRPSA